MQIGREGFRRTTLLRGFHHGPDAPAAGRPRPRDHRRRRPPGRRRRHPRTSRDDPPAALGAGRTPVRTARLVAGDFLLTVNPVDGSEIEPCPPGRQPEPPVRHTPEQRADRDRAAAPPVPAGPAAPLPPLLNRAEQRERLVQLLSRGRSVRLTGPAAPAAPGSSTPSPPTAPTSRPTA
ncbi:hypothetical protein [Streptomyces somaliensis]|uniref:hypothetical protein n=1 Tax=Streptomyces somaliensis TaxID=78355 RepID=UPI003F7530F4